MRNAIMKLAVMLVVLMNSSALYAAQFEGDNLKIKINSQETIKIKGGNEPIWKIGENEWTVVPAVITVEVTVAESLGKPKKIETTAYPLKDAAKDFTGMLQLEEPLRNMLPLGQPVKLEKWVNFLTPKQGIPNGKYELCIQVDTELQTWDRQCIHFEVNE